MAEEQEMKAGLEAERQQNGDEADTGPAAGGPLTIAGLCASAGGVEALQAFLSAMPADSGIAFVIAMHMKAAQTGTLPEMLQQYTDMPESAISTGLADYILPVGRNHILYSYGPIDRYLKLVPGEMSRNIVELAREGMELGLLATIREAVAQKETAGRRALRVRSDGGNQLIDLTVKPILEPPDRKGLFLVIFEPGRPTLREEEVASVLLAGEAAASEAKDFYTLALEKELRSTRQHLQSTLEEMQSAYEELQSANEELKTSKEEMQSINEELTTINLEYQSKNEQVIRINFEQYKIEHTFPQIGRRVMHLNARAMEPDIDGQELILLAIDDLTAEE